MKSILGLKEELGNLLDEAELLTAKRSLNHAEQARAHVIASKMEQLSDEIARRERDPSEGYQSVKREQSGGRGNTAYKAHTPDNINGIFVDYIRTGDQGMASELRAYNNTDANLGTPADGGYAVPTPVLANVVARRDEMMLAPKLGCTLVEGIGTTISQPVDGEADIVFSSVNEASTINQDLPVLDSVDLTLVKYAKHVTLSWELLADEAGGLMAWLNNWLARGWAGTHNSLLAAAVLADGTAGLTLDSATAIGATEIPELFGKVLPDYQERAQWLMNPATFAYLTGLSSSSMFTFAQNPGGNIGGTLWGRPANQSVYMPGIQASAKSLAVGDFSFVSYRDPGSLHILRDDYSAASTGQVKLWAWFRTCYKVTQAEALQYATHASA